MRERRRGQEAGLARLEEERAQLRDAAEALSERYEDVKDRGLSSLNLNVTCLVLDS